MPALHTMQTIYCKQAGTSRRVDPASSPLVSSMVDTQSLIGSDEQSILYTKLY